MMMTRTVKGNIEIEFKTRTFKTNVKSWNSQNTHPLYPFKVPFHRIEKFNSVSVYTCTITLEFSQMLMLHWPNFVFDLSLFQTLLKIRQEYVAFNVSVWCVFDFVGVVPIKCYHHLVCGRFILIPHASRIDVLQFSFLESVKR